MMFKSRLWSTLLFCLLACTHLTGNTQAPPYPTDFSILPQQDRALIRDLKLLTYPPKEWKIQHHSLLASPRYDVVIVGGGMAGLTAGAALFREGIYNIKIYDQNATGFEGPWINFARMKTLRSSKELVGPALDIPHLTFHAWFEAQWGQEAWRQLGKIPNSLWMDYLNWYRASLQLPVENHCKLISLTPQSDNSFILEFSQYGNPIFVNAEKVVLATGRGGFGGVNIPDFVENLPHAFYAHTCDSIDFSQLKGRCVAIIGIGASGFDAAAVALENGAKSVDMIMRRSRIPNVNKFASLYYKSLAHGFYKLDDQTRWNFMSTAFDAGIPPPVDSLQRLKIYQNFQLRPNTTIVQMNCNGSQVIVETNHGHLIYDFIILGTGFRVDGHNQPELSALIDQIALWQDKMPANLIKSNPTLGRFPYLGAIFEFQPKIPGTAPYLRNLYCFNYGATLSHALISSDIPAISIGARRLAEGIAADFFIQESQIYLQQLKDFHEEDFNQDDFFKATLPASKE